MASKRNPFDDANDARAEQAAQQAGIAAAMRRAAELGPQALALQQGLLGGIARSQEREAARLSKRGKDDPRVATARARHKAYTALAAQAGEQAELVGRFAETFQRDELFHGYVAQPDGTAAPDHTVLLEFVDEQGAGTQRKADAKTDAAGYFRIDLRRTDKDVYRAETARDSAWLERLVRAMPLEAETSDEDSATASAAPAPAAARSAVKTRVQVFDAGGHVAFVDPAPPEFATVASEFRYYVLTKASTSGAETGAKGR